MTVRVEVSSSGGVITVAAFGEIDFRNAAAVGEALREVLTAGTGEVRIDLSQVPFMDSTGMTTLVAAYLGGRRNGIPVVISAVHPYLREKLQITGILPLFEVIDAAPETVGALAEINEVILIFDRRGTEDGEVCVDEGHERIVRRGKIDAAAITHGEFVHRPHIGREVIDDLRQ